MYLQAITVFISVAIMFTSATASESNLQKRQKELSSVKTIAVMLPYPELDVWNRNAVTATKNKPLTLRDTAVLKQQICSAMKKKGINAVIIEVTDQNRTQIEEISNLSQIVLFSMEKHTVDNLNADYFPERVVDFNYSLGSLKAVADKYHADGVLCLHGSARVYTTEKNQDGKPGTYQTLFGVIADRDGFVLWANRMWYTNHFKEMDFETEDGMDRSLSFLFNTDMWGAEWKDAQK